MLSSSRAAAPAGTFEFPDFRCGGTLTPIGPDPQDASTVRMQVRLTFDSSGRCAEPETATLSVGEDLVQYQTTNGGARAGAVLSQE